MLADIHNHTCIFSPDARMTPDELISASVARGLSVVGVTEHFEYDNPDPMDDVQTFDLDEYDRAFAEWKDKCPSSLILLKGIEFGYQTHTAPVIDKIASSRDFDVVLLSNHIYDGRDVYYGGEKIYKTDKRILFSEYISKMAEMCENVQEFNVASHFDYINRYNPDPEAYILYEDCPEEFDRFFEALIAKDKCLEINTRSIHKLMLKGSSHIMHDEAIIKRYIAMGGKLISLGSDSHTSDTLGILFEETIEYLKSLGVNELCYFVKREPVLYTI